MGAKPSHSLSQSNSVAYAFDGSIIGMVQANNHASTRHVSQTGKLTSGDSDTTPRALALPFKQDEKSNATDLFVSVEMLQGRKKVQWKSLLEGGVTEEKKERASKLDGVACYMAAFLPFPDNGHRARKSGVRCLEAPGVGVKRRQMETHLIVFYLIKCRVCMMLTAFLVQLCSFDEQVFTPGFDIRMPNMW